MNLATGNEVLASLNGSSRTGQLNAAQSSAIGAFAAPCPAFERVTRECRQTAAPNRVEDLFIRSLTFGVKMASG